jgi:hypothetical protein
MKCLSCGGTDVSVITFEGVGGLLYRYCRECERSSWLSHGERLPTSQILEAAATIEPARRRS